MPRQLTIVGLGEVLLVEHPERTEAAGLAASIAVNAVRLGHVGIAISRVGQDEAAADLRRLLRDAGVDVAHLQSDPDLATGRVIERAIGGRIARYLETTAAFDNLQADFDLEDVAQVADAVVYGMLTRRGGQTRSAENRFLGACGAAVKVFDLTHDGDVGFNRGHALSGLELADAVILDHESLAALRPGADTDAPMESTRALMREEGLSFALLIPPANANGAAAVTLLCGDQSATATLPADRLAGGAFTVAMLVQLLRGNDASSTIGIADRVATHVAEDPSTPIPSELMS